MEQILLPFGLRSKTLRFIGFLMVDSSPDSVASVAKVQKPARLANQCKIVMEMQRMY